MYVHQMDVVTAFLNGTRDLYMQQPVMFSKENILYAQDEEISVWHKAITKMLE